MSDTDKIYSAQRKLIDAHFQLRKLASSFSETGNEIVAEKLWLLADNLDDAKREINEAVGAMLDGRLRDARQGTANLLNLSLALLSQKP